MTHINQIQKRKLAIQTKKISDTGGLVKKAYYSAEISEIESKIPNNGGLATAFVLTAVENKIPDVSNLVKKTDYNSKITDTEKRVTDHHHDNYITTSEFNKLTTTNLLQD